LRETAFCKKRKCEIMMSENKPKEGRKTRKNPKKALLEIKAEA